MTEAKTKVSLADAPSTSLARADEGVVSQTTPSLDSLEPNKRNLIDEDVFAWVTGCQTQGKVITPNLIRQKAYEIGRKYDPFFKASINWYNKWKKKYNYEESAEADALKHKKRSYTAAFKLYAVQRANELLSVSQASLELNVSRRCLQRWKEEIDVISKVAEQASNAVYRRPGQGRKVADTNLDTMLLDWLEQAWRNEEQVTSLTIRQKARELSTNQDFKASLGWFVKWQKRHNIDLKECTMNSPIRETKPEDPNSLRLRLLPEGQEITYSDRTNLTRKRKREFECPVIQGNEEFDRLLLTWLVERWEAGLLVNEKMLRDRAVELNTNQDFRPTKNWLQDWKSKYNVSLEEQTYGMAGESEGEIVEESQVYDEVSLPDNPLTPTKEEAATALASLASKDPTTAGGMEIAQALQKLASAFGLTQGDVSKNTLVEQLQLHDVTDPSPLPSSSLSSVLTPSTIPSTATTYLLENGEVQVGAEEVISEEVVTDEPVVVLETTNGGDMMKSAVNMPGNMVGNPGYHHTTTTTTNEQQQMVMVTPTTQPTIPSSIENHSDIPPQLKIPALDNHGVPIPPPATTVVHLNSSDTTHIPNVNILTTLGGPHMVTTPTDIEMTPSSETMTMGEVLTVNTTDVVDQLSLPSIDIEKCPSEVSQQVEDKMMFEQSSMVRVNVPDQEVTVESEIEISEPLIVNVVSAESTVEGLDEPMVLLFKGDHETDNKGSSNDIIVPSSSDITTIDEFVFEDTGSSSGTNTNSSTLKH